MSKQVELGAIVSPGQTLAEAFTDESLNVVVSVGEAEASLIPGLFEGKGAEAEVQIAFAGTSYVTLRHGEEGGAGTRRPHAHPSHNGFT